LEEAVLLAASCLNFSLFALLFASHCFTSEAVAIAALFRCSYMNFFALSVT
jgi:hypothetical protein